MNTIFTVLEIYIIHSENVYVWEATWQNKQKLNKLQQKLKIYHVQCKLLTTANWKEENRVTWGENLKGLTFRLKLWASINL